MTAASEVAEPVHPLIVSTPAPDATLLNTKALVPLPKVIAPLLKERLPTVSENPFRLRVLLFSVRLDPALMALVTASWRVPPLTVVAPV